MKAFIARIVKKQWRIKILDRIEDTVHSMSLAEKVAWYGALFVFAFASIQILSKVNDMFLITIPTRGGTLTEGIVGTPRFVNPLLDISDADRDLSSLVYSGLMKALPDGTLVPDLASTYSVSDDGLSYIFTLKDSLAWSDGQPITTDDIEFTILKAQDSGLKSPRRAMWEGVTIEKQSPTEIRFILRQPYALFLENTTMGILPKHIWKSIEIDEFPFSQFNVEPIGSGPFVVNSVKRNENGIPSRYELVPNDDYALGAPFIEKLIIQFYQNEKTAVESYQQGDIQSLSGISPIYAKDFNTDHTPYSKTPLTRIFGIFFNQNQNEVLLNKEVRAALDKALDKNAIINDVFYGFGTVASAPFPTIETSLEATSTASSTRREEAIALLEKAGWKINPDTGVREKTTKGVTQKIFLSLSTSNVPELVQTARMVEEAWKNIGVGVDVRIFETSDLNQNVIRPRKYDALLFGTVTGRNPDLYAFWHSSQRNDPGLNIALYTNSKADSILENIRTEKDKDKRTALYESFNEEIKKDLPALFLYSPQFIYSIPDSIKNIHLETITTPSDRFSNIYQWYIETDNVWTFFSQEYYIREGSDTLELVTDSATHI